ncbi:MAG: tetratricopeptide repeat protein [Candidatus Levybacteria bacterium]|nr:tetratricopeptide repeat protein [Candidatus Levybacteria bacterium]
MNEKEQEPFLNFFNPLTIPKAIYIIIILGFIVFFNSLFNGFVWDDVGQIINNTKAHSIQNIVGFFAGGTFDPGNNVDQLAGTYYKPFMTIFFSSIYTVFGQNAFYFHFFQIAFHIINTTLVFILFSHFFSKKLSLFLSLIFLAHPINVESAVYISAVQEVLFFFFGMLAILIVFKANQSEKQSGFFSLIATPLLLLSSLLSKETGILFVVIVTTYIFLFHVKRFKQYFATSLLSIGTYLGLRFFVGKIYFSSIHVDPIATASMLERLITIPKIILFYVYTFFIPVNLSVGQMWLVKNFNAKDFFIPLIIVGVFFLVLLAFGVFIWKKKLHFPTYLFFVFWFLIGLGLHLQIFPLDMTVADRWFYFPMVGLLGIIGVSANAITIKNTNIKIIMYILIITCFIIFCLRSIVRNTDWNSSYSLFSRDALVNRDNFYLQNKLGIELYLLGDNKRAKDHFQQSIDLLPTASAFSSMGLVFMREGNLSQAEKYLGKAIQMDSHYYPAYHNRIYILLKANNSQRSLEAAQQALKIFPNNDQLWILLALAEYKVGHKQNAIQAITHAYNLLPTAYTKEVQDRIVKNQPIDDF